jgi:hypothetical protein|tara:strand:+ start:1883 stop:2050 length:168 start_codon:yes stop_codon:yes gene_type:complete
MATKVFIASWSLKRAPEFSALEIRVQTNARDSKTEERGCVFVVYNILQQQINFSF